MNKDEIIRMAQSAGVSWSLGIGGMEDFLERFAHLVAAREREEIAKMFDEPMRIVPFGQNEEGGCLMCGFTPKRAAEVIRKRGKHD